jgi:hypothetical protein
MSDFFTTEEIETLSARSVRITALSTFAFTSGTTRAWNGNYPLTVGGNTYLPAKGTAQIDNLNFPSNGSSNSVTTTVSGLPDEALGLLAAALAGTQEVDQQVQTVALQLFDDDWQPSGLPIPVFAGFMQPPAVSRSPMRETEGGTQGITLEARDIFFNRSLPPHGRNTDRDQQARSPGDKFFGFVSSILVKTVLYPDY